jgi:hypothetical protein
MISSYGKLRYDSGNVYEGQFLNGKRSGNGTMLFSNGDSYTGMWKKDQMCDHDGIFTFANKNEYKGSLTTCSKLASGKYGMFHGAASLQLKDFGNFTGSFDNGSIHGDGKFEFFRCDQTFEGRWDHTPIEEFIAQME